MKKLILLIALSSLSQLSIAQLPVIEDVIKVACKDFNNSKVPVEDMMKEEVEQIFIESRQDYLSDWDSTQRVFTQQVLLPFKYDEYFIRRLETECPAFRPAKEKYYDMFLLGQNNKRILYLQAKEFLYNVEDGASNSELFAFLDDQAPITEGFLEILSKEAMEQKATSTLNFSLLDDYTFRCEYRDYITTENNFRIDILFTDASDLLINNIRITSKFALEQGYEGINVNHDIDVAPLFTGEGN